MESTIESTKVEVIWAQETESESSLGKYLNKFVVPGYPLSFSFEILIFISLSAASMRSCPPHAFEENTSIGLVIL